MCCAVNSDNIIKCWQWPFSCKNRLVLQGDLYLDGNFSLIRHRFSKNKQTLLSCWLLGLECRNLEKQHHQGFKLITFEGPAWILNVKYLSPTKPGFEESGRRSISKNKSVLSLALDLWMTSEIDQRKWNKMPFHSDYYQTISSQSVLIAPFSFGSEASKYNAFMWREKSFSCWGNICNFKPFWQQFVLIFSDCR